MNAAPSSLATNVTPVDDMVFSEMLRQWIVGFHGNVAPLSIESVDARVRSYMHQELQYQEKVKFVLSLLPDLPKVGLDVGSSAGGLSVAFAQQGILMQGVEPSLPGVEVSRQRAARLGIGNAFFSQGVGEELPFENDSFDFVISLAVLEHVQNIPAVVSEVFRTLKPGGYAYFEVPNNLFPYEGHYKMAWLPMMPKGLAKRYVAMRGAYPGFLNDLHYMSRSIITRHFENAGFIDCRDVASDFLVGKAACAPWSSGSGRLAKMPWCVPLIRLFFGYKPMAWFTNRAICLIVKKPGVTSDQ
jgi:2-polyprenyl-3-methyl-5-hydroxy-6-metoxy-1,4-benzoquinol methylase